MATKTEKNVQLKINKMTKNIFDQLSAQGLISEDELYLLPEDEEKSIQEQIDEIEAKIPSAATSENQLADKAFVNSKMVVQSQTNPGYAANADHALQASASDWAINAGYAENAGYARGAESANTALSATYATNYTPLSTFNETLGDLSSIIHEI